MGEAFEVVARKLGEYIMKNFFIPWMREHGVVQTYRAQVVSVDSNTKTMEVKRPFDQQITLPYSDSASNLSAGDQCIVVCLGDSSNATIISDGKLNL